MNNIVLEVTNLWETKPNVYLLACNSNREKQHDIYPNNNYIFDVVKSVLRETKFRFVDEWNGRLMEYFNLGEVSAFHTFKYEGG